MDAWCKVTLTVCVVAAVLAVAHRLGRRAAGVVAGLPLTSAPALVWLAHDAGGSFAAGAAVGSVAAISMFAAFVLAYARVARRGGARLAIVAGLAGACALAGPALASSGDWTAALGLALPCCAAAWWALPALRSAAAAVPPQRASAPVLRPQPLLAGRAALLTVAAAAGVSALAAAIAPLAGMFAAGLVASLPVVSASVAVAEHVAGGHAAVAEFLRGYVLGLVGRAVFGTVFALAAVPFGAACALALGCAAAGLVAGVALAAECRRAAGRVVARPRTQAAAPQPLLLTTAVVAEAGRGVWRSSGMPSRSGTA